MIVIASDHGGYALKQELMAHLKEKGVEFEDCYIFVRKKVHGKIKNIYA